MTTLVLCRHAEVGDAHQSGALARELSGLTLAAVYTSPLARAVETAQAVAARRGVAPCPLDGLREIELGQVAGLEFDELPRDLQDGLLHEPAEVRFPGGESYLELQQRVCAALDHIVGRHAGETVAAISHAGSIRAALARWLLIDSRAIFRIDQRHASINVVDWFEGTPLVRLVNGARL
jgi:alpha-ribazole phosphatase